MAYVLAQLFPPQFEDANGNPLVLGTIEFYIYNNTTPTPFYTDSAGTSGGTSCALNSLGQPVSGGGTNLQIFLDTAVTYKVIRKDASGTQINPTLGPFSVGNPSLGADLASSSGASLIGYAGGTVASLFLSSVGHVVDSIAALEAIDKTEFTRAFVTGYYAAGDGGGGAYWYDSSDTTSADNGGTIIVATDGARWKLIYTGRVSVKQFGAKGDGSTNDRPAFSAACGALQDIYVPIGQYLFGDNTTVSCSYGQDILGESSHSTLRPGSGLVTLEEGSVILVTSTTASPFTYYSANRFNGLTFYYPNQSRTAVTPTVYPATFTWNAAGSSEVFVNNTWQNLQFVNSYIWIDALQGHLDYEFYDIVGCPIYRGIRTDGCGGTDLFARIRGSYYYWCQSGDNAAVWILANSTGIELGRSDAFHMDRIYFGNLNVGLRFYQGSVNTVSGPYGSITGLSLDGNNYGVYSESTHAIGVNITEMMANSISQDIEIAALGPDLSNIQVTGFKWWGAHTNGLRMNRVCTMKLSSGEIYSTAGPGIISATASCDLMMSDIRYGNMGVQSPLALSAQFNSLMLSNNQFNMAPTLAGTPATIQRFRGNAYLGDATVGA